MKLIETETKITKANNNKMRKIKMSELNLYGVDNLKNVAVALTKLVNAGIASYSDDGKITIGDIGHGGSSICYDIKETIIELLSLISKIVV